MVLPRLKKATKTENFAGTGRRKTSVARVYLQPGKGAITINDRPAEQYFMGRTAWQLTIKSPLEITNLMGKLDVKCNVDGGGITGQAGAVRHGIARALLVYDEGLRQTLKKAGFLTRDPREKERKKYGRKRARAGFQWTKR